MKTPPLSRSFGPAPGTPREPLSFLETAGAVGCGVLLAAAILTVLALVVLAALTERGLVQ